MGPKKIPESSAPPAVFQLSDEQLDILADKVTDKLEAKLAIKNMAVTEKIDGLEAVSTMLRDKADDLEQQNRLENLRIFGIEEKKGENTNKLVLQLANKLKVKLPESSIGRSHRVGPVKEGKTRPIIVKFVSFADRKKLFMEKKHLKGTGITIKEDLTSIRQTVLKNASEAFSKEQVWSDMGAIVIKTDKNYHRVKTQHELEKLIQELLTNPSE